MTLLQHTSNDYLDWLIEEDSSSLDLFSTSPTSAFLVGFGASPSVLRCVNHAPFFAYQAGVSKYVVIQGNCNSWNCPRCGQMVAKQHYGRIVEGCRTLGKTNDLYFITLTCRGREITESEAMQGYLSWTSKFLDAAYTKTKREGKKWAYVQVTEKQKRGHPHSHVITTFNPNDLCLGHVEKWRKANDGALIKEDIPALRSTWVLNQCEKSGLGTQYDISQVGNIEACSRYVAKYMFKDAQFKTVFPKHWKRVRYSQSFPKLPDHQSNAFVLLSREDWLKLQRLAVHVSTHERSAFEEAKHFLSGSDTIVTLKEKQNEKLEG